MVLCSTLFIIHRQCWACNHAFGSHFLLQDDEWKQYGICDGSFQQRRFFHCAEGRGLFLKSSLCRPVHDKAEDTSTLRKDSDAVTEHDAYLVHDKLLAKGALGDWRVLAELLGVSIAELEDCGVAAKSQPDSNILLTVLYRVINRRDGAGDLGVLTAALVQTGHKDVAAAVRGETEGQLFSVPVFDHYPSVIRRTSSGLV